MGLTPQLTPALDEIDFGAFAGRSFDALAPDPEWQEWNAARQTARCPGGETMAEAVARASDYLSGLSLDAGPALCVTHCDVIRGVVADMLGLSYARMFAFDCDPASVATLDWGSRRVIALNQRVPR